MCVTHTVCLCPQVGSECRERGALMGVLWSQVKGVLELRAGLEAEARLGAMQVRVCVLCVLMLYATAAVT